MNSTTTKIQPVPQEVWKAFKIYEKDESQYIFTKIKAVDLIRNLLKEDLHAIDESNNGNTPLIYASAYGYIELVKALINAGVETDKQNNNSKTALYVASMMGQSYTARILLKKGANPNIADSDNKTPLHIAAEKENNEIIKLLLLHNANINAQMNNGQTPLMLASISGNFDIVKILVEHGANINLTEKRRFCKLLEFSKTGIAIAKPESIRLGAYDLATKHDVIQKYLQEQGAIDRLSILRSC